MQTKSSTNNVSSKREWMGMKKNEQKKWERERAMCAKSGDNDWVRLNSISDACKRIWYFILNLWQHKVLSCRNNFSIVFVFFYLFLRLPFAIDVCVCAMCVYSKYIWMCMMFACIKLLSLCVYIWMYVSRLSFWCGWSSPDQRWWW